MEYARYYGHLPHDGQPWHEVLAMVTRRVRFDARELVQRVAQENLLHPESQGVGALTYGAVHREAYPWLS